MANRIITAATIIALLTPLAACGTSGGGLASAPEHQADTIADTQLPDHIVNGDFSYKADQLPFRLPIMLGEATWTYVHPDKGIWTDDCLYPNHNASDCYVGGAGRVNTGTIAGFDAARFGWKSDEPAMNVFPSGPVEIQRSVADGQVYAEIVAENGNYTIYQDIQAEGGTVLTWSLKHAPRGATYTGGDEMSVMIGPPGRETVQKATRMTNNGSGDRVGETMTLIHTSKPNDTTFAPWETYSGTYTTPGTGMQTIRFTFRAGSAGSTGRSGNLIDDVSFEKTYPLNYDMNGGTGGPKQSR